MTGIDSLRLNFEKSLMLPKSAVDWLLMLWGSIQVFDDVADGGSILRADLDAAIWNTLVAMHENQFFAENSKALLPCIATAVLKWQASDKAERAGDADAKSFVWRAGFYDLVLMVVQLCHGPKAAIELASVVMNLYGESYAEYLQEFGKCQIQ